MESFLYAAKTVLADLSAYKKIRIVLGNETCDLDSAVSTLVQAFTEYMDIAECNEKDIGIIPLLNIPRREYRVKTEVVFFLKLLNIPFDLLVFRDQIDLQDLRKQVTPKLEVILVDHHVLTDQDIFLADVVTKIIDHRPHDMRWLWPGRELHLEIVGSCATLVARNLLEKHPKVVDSRLANLLRGPILIDTHNLSKEAGRATVVDIKIVESLEKTGQLNMNRDEMFNRIVDAKADVSQLTANDLLIRDLKVSVGVPIVGLPMLVKEFLQIQDALKSVKDFAKIRKTTVIVLMGLDLNSDTASRDIAIFSMATDRLGDQIIDALRTSTQPHLELSLIREIREEDENFRLLLYAQRNFRVTRKHILPIIRESIIMTCRC